MLRIGISGPGGAGKTVLAAQLAASLGAVVVDEGIRQLLAAEDHPWQLEWPRQLSVQADYLARKIAAERRLRAFVSDRTAVDLVSLLRLRAERQAVKPPTRLIAEALAHAASGYDLAVLLHWRMAAIDEAAGMTVGLRRREHALTATLYRRLGIPVLEVPSLPRGEVLPFVAAAVRRLCPARLARLKRRPVTEALQTERDPLDPVRSRCSDLARRCMAAAPGGALYLWGSATRGDFDPHISDIDLLLVANDDDAGDGGPDLEPRLLAAVEAEAALDLSVLYRGELAGGPLRSTLARRIHPRLLLAEASNWRLIAGAAPFTANEYLPPTPQETISRRREACLRRMHAQRVETSPEAPKYLFKELAMLCHAQHQVVLGPHGFDYAALRAMAAPDSAAMVQTILDLRAAGWNASACHAAMPQLEAFMARRGLV
jgi:predicted ATPase